MKARNITLIAILSALLISPLLLFGAQHLAKAPLPSWLTAEDATYLSGDTEAAKVRPYANLKGFLSTDLQSALESRIESYVPLKATVLLGNASLQRAAIAASNNFFGFEAYPTFFGSEHIYLPAQDAVAAAPLPADDTMLHGIEEFAQQLAGYATAHPELEFCLVLADQSDTSAANPAASLVSNAFSTEDVEEILATPAKLDNVHLVCVAYDDPDAYYRDYYKTDHHWNGYGALAAYRMVSQEMSLADSRDNNTSAVTFGDLVMEGSYAREGLMFVDDKAREPRYDTSGLTLDSKKIAPVLLPTEEGVEELLSDHNTAIYNFYSKWYGTYQQAAKAPLVNEAAPSSDNALIVMDSFGNALHWLIAQNYRETFCCSDNKGASSGKGVTLDERIASSRATTIYFIQNVSAYSRLTSYHPDYFAFEE